MATLTITTTADQDARIAAAFGSYLGLQGSATGPQVKQAIIAWVRDVVRQQEYQAALEAVPQPALITPT